MDVGQQVTRSNDEYRQMMPHDVPIRTSAPPPSREISEGPAAGDASATGSEVWSGAINRLQTQVSLNTSLLDSHRQKVHNIEQAVQRLDQAIGSAMTLLQDVRAEMRARPAPEQARRESRTDPEDLQVLAEQVGTITNRVNEVDALRMQVRLLENRMKRFEENPPRPAHSAQSMVGGTSRESSVRQTPTSVHMHGGPHPPTLMSHQPLPPIRTSAQMSPMDNRSILSSSEHRQPSVGSSATMQGSTASGFRLTEQLPPPSALPGWRQTEPQSSSSSVPVPSEQGSGRSMSTQQDGHASGWAAVNAIHPAKRTYEEQRHSPYESAMTGSPKRPKLAPIMPRSTFGEDASYVPSSVPKSSTADSYPSHSRAPSDSSQSQLYNLPTPASGHLPGHRFIVSTQSADSQESWRPEIDRAGPPSRGPGTGHHVHPGPGRRGGRGMRGRGRGGRGGRGVVLVTDPADLGTPEWERADWTGSQISSNGYYHPLHHQHSVQSPEQANRGELVRRPGVVVGRSSDRETSAPATQLTTQGSYESFVSGNPESMSGPGSGGKKTRTKPIRNAEGVLIRKDGRPDMRSVSSANNLRKVHAKKEAERVEVEGRTPTSARSLAPAESMSDDEGGSGSGSPPETRRQEADNDLGPTDTQERQKELMSRIFPSGVEEASKSAAARFFPAHTEEEPGDGVKIEPGSESQAFTPSADQGASQITDVVMREMADAQAEDTVERQDTVMSTVDEAEGVAQETSHVEV